MKIIITKTMILLTLFVVMSCSEESFMNNTLILDGEKIKDVFFTGMDFQYGEETRSTVLITEKGASFLWNENDTIGIFPSKGDQVSFAVVQGAGTQTAKFSGGGWALKSSSTYAAYYPYDFYNRNLTKIPISYRGQAQKGNANTEHIGTYDFMAASMSTPSGGAVSFDMKHLGCLIQLTINVPQPTTLNKVTLVSNGEFIQDGALDLTAENIKIIPISVANTFEIYLRDIRTTIANEEVVIYFMIPPTDLSTKSLKAQIATDSGDDFEISLVPKNFIAGKIYALKAPKLPQYTLETFVVDSCAHPFYVGGVISNYSEDFVKKGIIVSVDEDKLYYNDSVDLGLPYQSYHSAYTGDLETKVFDCTTQGKEQFNVPLTNILGNTKYYVKAFVVNKKGEILYGNTIELESENFNRDTRYGVKYDFANVYYSTKYTLFDLVTDEYIDYVNDGCYYSSNESSTYCSFAMRVPGSMYKFKTKWNYKLWYYNNPLHCDEEKMVGVPVMEYVNGKLKISKQESDVDKNVVFYYSINENGRRPESFHLKYDEPIEINVDDIVYCYAISDEEYISFTNVYKRLK